MFQHLIMDDNNRRASYFILINFDKSSKLDAMYLYTDNETNETEIFLDTILIVCMS